MTGGRDEERPHEEAENRPPEPENPLAELIERVERFGWRPAALSWAESERRRLEKARRREELMIAWRRRRIQPAPEEPSEDQPEKGEAP